MTIAAAAPVIVQAGEKAGSVKAPSSVAILIVGLGAFMLTIGLTGGKKWTLPKYSVLEWSGGGSGGSSGGGGGGSGADIMQPPDVPAVSTGSWVNPLSSMTITQAFKGLTTGVVYNTGQHRGEDYRAKYGTPAYAVANATVVGVTKGGLKRVGPGTYQGTFNSAYGPNSVELLTDSGYSVVYGHFSDVAVKVGDRVAAGQVLGHTGSSTGFFGGGDHLHIEVTKTVNGVVNWFRTSVLMKGAQNPANMRTSNTTGGITEQ